MKLFCVSLFEVTLIIVPLYFVQDTHKSCEALALKGVLPFTRRSGCFVNFVYLNTVHMSVDTQMKQIPCCSFSFEQFFFIFTILEVLYYLAYIKSPNSNLTPSCYEQVQFDLPSISEPVHLYRGVSTTSYLLTLLPCPRLDLTSVQQTHRVKVSDYFFGT